MAIRNQQTLVKAAEEGADVVVELLELPLEAPVEAAVEGAPVVTTCVRHLNVGTVRAEMHCSATISFKKAELLKRQLI
jgi:hypothetical protein